MSDIDKYKVPKNVVKIPDGDTGYNMIKKSYNRFIWTWNDAPKNEDDDYTESDAEPTKMKYIKEHEEHEQIPGGLSSGKSVEEIAEEHDVPVEEIEDQLTKGITVETEHTPNTALAMEIAMDHLMEDPKYYDHLADMEAEVETKTTPEVEESKIGDGVWNGISTREVPGTGTPGNIGAEGTVGYKSGPLSKNIILPSEWVADDTDDEKEARQMKNMKNFNDFFKQ